MKWLPDRKWLASGVSGVLAYFVTTFLFPDMGVEEATSIVGAIMLAVHYLVPASVGDIIKRIDDTIVRIFNDKKKKAAGPDKGPSGGTLSQSNWLASLVAVGLACLFLAGCAWGGSIDRHLKYEHINHEATQAFDSADETVRGWLGTD